MQLLGCSLACNIFSFEGWMSAFFCFGWNNLRFGYIPGGDSFSFFSPLRTSFPDKSVDGPRHLLISLVWTAPHTLRRTWNVVLCRLSLVVFLYLGSLFTLCQFLFFLLAFYNTIGLSYYACATSWNHSWINCGLFSIGWTKSLKLRLPRLNVGQWRHLVIINRASVENETSTLQLLLILLKYQYGRFEIKAKSYICGDYTPGTFQKTIHASNESPRASVTP